MVRVVSWLGGPGGAAAPWKKSTKSGCECGGWGAAAGDGEGELPGVAAP